MKDGQLDAFTRRTRLDFITKVTCVHSRAGNHSCLSRDRSRVVLAARGVGYVLRALAEKKVTRSRFEAYLILTSAATFLFIGALGDLLAHW